MSATVYKLQLAVQLSAHNKVDDESKESLKRSDFLKHLPIKNCEKTFLKNIQEIFIKVKKNTMF